MLNEKALRKIGNSKCIEVFGREFVEKYKDTACGCHNYYKGKFRYWIGLTDEPEPENIHLCAGETPYKYFIDMLIDRNTGAVIVTDYRIP